MPWFVRPTAAGAVGVAGLAGFAVITVLVQLQLLSGMDRAIAFSMQYVESPVLDWWSMLAGNLAAAEMSVLYAAVISVVMWRKGAGWWSVAPFALVVPTAVELVSKSWLDQPPIPRTLRFHVPVNSSFPTIVLEGSFPSGHSLRSAFICTFLAVLIRSRGGRFAGVLALLTVAVAPAIGLAMMYAAWHWTSDVVAGFLLGSSFALLLAPTAAQKLRPPRPRSPAPR
ncbi:MAG: phosphatase PAP2 family protein [Chloroflexi bacterium]|nr:phosphatase PAP2 family protein [Chloroflexota bacterium]